MMRSIMSMLLAIPILLVLNATAVIPSTASWLTHVSVGMCAVMISDAWLRDFFRLALIELGLLKGGGS